MNEREIFQQALEIAEPAQRQKYLHQACGSDAALRARIEALLASDKAASQFLNVPVLEQGKRPAADSVSPTITVPPFGQPNSNRNDEEEDETPRGPDLSFLQPSSKPGSLGTLGHYEILQLLGQGAFGIVFKAFDEKLHRLVAIKAMNPQLAATSPPRKRFLREARSVAAIKHENIVQVYSVEEQPLPYLVMEYIDGPTLQQKLNGSGPLEVAEVLHLGRQMASGLAAAHAQGLIHRDIKPGNILLESGPDQKVKITDFGLARATDDASMTRTGMIAGTPMYMAPEQALGQPLDHRADLFSLGSVLYQMACGRPPFRASTTVAVLKRVADETPRPIQEILSEVPEWLCAIIARLHAKKPDERFQSAKEVADLLARCQSELQQHGRVELPSDILPITPRSLSKEQRPVSSERQEIKPRHTSASHPRRERRWLAAAAAIVALFVGLLSLTEATGVTNMRGTVIRLFSPDGTLVVEVDNPGVSVTIDGEELIITGTGAKEIRLKPGQYKVVASKDGKVVSQELVTVTKDGRQVVRVSKEAESEPAPKPAVVMDRRPQFRTGGDWLIEQGELVQALPEKACLFFGNENWTDYDFEVEAMSNGRTKDGHGISLAFRAKDLGNYLDIEVGGWSATVTEAVFFKDGKWGRSPGCFLKIPHEHGRWYKVKVEVRGPRVRCSVDGKDLLAYSDDTLLKGMIGVGTGNSPVRWRNLKVTAPDGTLLWEGFPKLDSSSKDARVPAPGSQANSISPRYKNSLGMEFSLVPKGKAWLGGGGGKVGDISFEVKEDFYLGVHEVTQEVWTKVMGSNPSSLRSAEGLPEKELEQFPVDNVSWEEAQEFVKLLNEKIGDPGWVYRLPKAAEWEYACRGGVIDRTDSAFDYYFDKPTSRLLPVLANFHHDDGLQRTCKVGSYPPNRLGLHDMHGNVWELCDDVLPGNGVATQVMRGGCWKQDADFCRARISFETGAKSKHPTHGLRVARVPTAFDSDRQAAEWATNVGGTVFVSLKGKLLTVNPKGKLPAEKFAVERIDFPYGTRISDADLAPLGRLTGLQSLILTGTPVGDGAALHLVKIAGLTDLHLADTKMGDDGVVRLKELKGLRLMTLAGTSVGDRSVVSLGELLNLEDLNLHNTAIGDLSVAAIAKCPKLRVLHLTRTNVTDGGLTHLAGVKTLRHLTLFGNKVTEAGVNKLRAARPDCKIDWESGDDSP